MTFHERGVPESTVHKVLQPVHLSVHSTDKYGFDMYDNDNEHEV